MEESENGSESDEGKDNSEDDSSETGDSGEESDENFSLEETEFEDSEKDLQDKESELENIEEEIINSDIVEEDMNLVMSEDDIASGVNGNVTWVLNADGKLTVTGTGKIKPYYSSAPWYDVRDSIVSAEVQVTGTTDAANLFRDCSNLVSIDLSGFDTSVITDMSAMFYGCKSLVSLDLSNFDTGKVTNMWAMFSECESLTEINLSSFNTESVQNMASMFSGCKSLMSLDISNFSTGKVTRMEGMFSACSSLTILDLKGIDTSNVRSIGRMFSHCSSLVDLDISGFNTGNATSMNGMFRYCGSLKNLDLTSFDTSKVEDMENMFTNCTNLINLNLSSFDTSNVTTMDGMFDGCNSLEDLDISNFNTGNVTTMWNMFRWCDSLKRLDLSNFNTEKVTDMACMFMCRNLEYLDVSSFNTSNVVKMDGMFGCDCLKSLDLSNFNTDNVTDMSDMFGNCSSLTELDLGNFNTCKVTDMSWMFHGCNSLTSLNIGNFDTRNVTSMNRMFSECSSLTNLDLSNFDVGSVTDTSEMLDYCTSLMTIKTPLNLTQPARLPMEFGDDWETNNIATTWYDPDGEEITELPQNLSYSIEIERKINDKKLAAPVFSPTGGNVIKGIRITLSAAQNAVIYYTTDGSIPVSSATGVTKKYTAPIIVDKDMAIKAIAVDLSGQHENSDIAEAVYVACTNNFILGEAELTLREGEEYTISIKELPENRTAEDVEWSSDAASIVTVDNNGKLTAIATGRATIKARVPDVQGMTIGADCTVIVYGSEGAPLTLKPGEATQVQIPSGVSTKNARYTSENPTVATVSSKGLVTAVAIGKTTVIFEAGSIKIAYTVTVSNPLRSISFEESELALETGETETNRIIFRPAYTETDRLLTVSTADESVAVAAVSGKTVRITGVAEGETTVTAKSGQLEASCTVTVHKAAEAPDIKENIVYALTNRDRTLADLKGQLPSGFEFQNPETVLPQFAGVSEKEFAVIYTDENGRKVRSVQNVRFLTIKGIEPTVDNDAIEISDTSAARLSVRYLWEGYDAPGDVKEGMLKDYNLEVTPSKSGIVTVAEEEDFFAITGTAKGKVKLAVVLRKTGVPGKAGIVCQGAVNITVVEKKADIRIDVDGAEYDAEKDYYYVKDIKNAVVSLKALAEGYKVTWASSDTGVATVGKAVDGVARVTIKTNGKVTLTATANDTGKTSGSIRLYIVDATPSIDKAVTVNKAMEEGGTLGIYGSYGYGIEQFGVQLMKKENHGESDTRFAIDYNRSRDTYEVTLTDGAEVKEGKHPVCVKVTADTDVGKQEYFEELVITVINKPVTWSVKQPKKVNLFYTDEEGDGSLTLSCKNAVIEDAILSECDFVYNYANRSLGFEGNDYENIDRDGILTVKFEGYREVSKNISIKTEVKKPKIAASAASSVLYPNAGITKAKIRLTNKTTGNTLYVETGNINQPKLGTDAYRVAAEEGNIYLELKEGLASYPSSAKVSFALQMNNWNDEISLSHTVKYNKAPDPSLKLSSGTLTLNRNSAVARYQEAGVQVQVKNATEDTVLSGVSVGGADKKSLAAMEEGLDFAFEPDTGRLEVSFNDSTEVAKGTYKYNINTVLPEGKNVKTSLKVAVVDKAPASAVTVSTKGSIDLLDRAGSGLTCTPKLNGVSGDIVGVRLDGRDAHLFSAELDGMGRTLIKAREDAAYITKYAYSLQLVYTLESGERQYNVTSKPLSVKVRQGSAKLRAELSSTQLYQAAGNALNVDLTATNAKGGKLEVADAAIIETKAIKGAFEMEYSEAAGCYQLSLKDAGKVKKGKTYSIKLNVRLSQQADNEKPKTVTVKVKIQ